MADLNIRTTITADSVQRLFGPPGAVDYRSHPGQKESDHPASVFENMKRNEVPPLSDIRYLKGTVYSFKNRRTICRWLRDVCSAFHLKSTTLCLSVQLTDAFITATLDTLRVEQCQLAAVTCLWIAAKFEEMDDALPHLKSIVEICDGAYTAKEVLSMEETILIHFRWRLPHTTVLNHLYLGLHMLSAPELLPPSRSNPVTQDGGETSRTILVTRVDGESKQIITVPVPFDVIHGAAPTLRQLAPQLCAASRMAMSRSLEVFQLIGSSLVLGKRVSLDEPADALLLYSGEAAPNLFLSTTANSGNSIFADRGTYTILKTINGQLLDLCDVLIQEVVLHVEFLRVACNITALGCLALAQCIVASDAEQVKPGIQFIHKTLNISATQALATGCLLATKISELQAAAGGNLVGGILLKVPEDIRNRLETVFMRKLTV